MRRYIILLSAVVMQLCLGATYSWAVYVQPLKAVTGLLQGPVQLPFSVFYFAFPATMIISGSLLPRIGPRFSSMAGGILFGGGWMLASLGQYHFELTIVGIGILAGIGAGFAYIVPIATCIRWFPKQKGLVTGIAVAGFGGGAALVSQLAGFLMNSKGASPFDTFRILGLIFLLLVSLTGLAMRNPAGSENDRGKSLSIREILTHRAFKVLYFAMFTGLAAGFAINANLKELSYGQSVQIGITAVSLFAIANALGRIIWGLIFDRINSASAIQANLFCQAILLFIFVSTLTTTFGFLTFAFLAGFNYGGVLVVYAGSTARIWGNEHVGQVYGWLFSANIPAALSPVFAGYGFDRTGRFTTPLIVIGILLLSASAIVKKAKKTIF